jgi:hypothetical protein
LGGFEGGDVILITSAKIRTAKVYIGTIAVYLL